MGLSYVLGSPEKSLLLDINTVHHSQVTQSGPERRRYA